ncbi:MAG TPA: RHS repeat-associated core domain-containing protein [Gammaproteobacteria bacterium]
MLAQHKSEHARGGITDIGYDSMSRIETVTDPKGAIIETRTFDAMGNIKTRADSQGRTHDYDYDLNNNLIRHTDPKGQITELAYDELDRLVRISDADGRLTEYRHDLAGRLVQVLDTVNGEVRYEYDLLNRLTREITDRGVIDYQHDATNRLVQRTVNGSEVTDYEYDAVGRIVRINYSGQNGNTQTLAYTYNAVGQLETKTGPNGIIQSHDYDAAGRLTRIIYTSPEGEELERIDYAFDPSGQIVQKTRSDGTAVPETPFVATYGDDNQMLTFDGHPLAYDDNGNLIERQTDTGRLVYEYNSDNRLIRFERFEGQETQPAVSATYAYDKDGRRIKKTVADEAGTTETNFTWDGTRLIAERDENGNLVKSYRYGLGFAPTQVIDANGIYDVHVDHLDTPQSLTDQNGNIVWKADYAAYGTATVNEDSDNDGNHIVFNTRFPGQYFDAESGLHYNFHRYYDSGTGRYITRDPIGLKGGMNFYQYVGSNPMRAIDPYGLDPGDYFNSPDAAAADAIRFARGLSPQFIEYAGQIETNGNGQYWAAGPIRGNGGTVRLPDPGDNTVAEYHTHPDRVFNSPADSQFSPQDRARSDHPDNRRPSFLGGPDGSISKYDPATGSTTTLGPQTDTGTPAGGDSGDGGNWSGGDGSAGSGEGGGDGC